MATRSSPRLAPALAALALAGLACGGGGDSPPPPLGGVGDPCTSASRCQAGLVCFEGLCAAEAPASATCTPATHLPAVVDGGILPIVEADWAGCVDSPRPANPGLDAVALGDHAVGTSLDFEIPAGTASFSIVSQEMPGTAWDTVVIQGYEFANAPVPANALFPGGALFYDDMDSWFTSPEALPSLPAFAFGFAAQTGAFSDPSTSAGIDRLYTAGGAEAGSWRLTVNDYARECLVSALEPYCAGGSSAGRYDVRVVRKPGPIASTGRLDLALYLVSPLLPQGNRAALLESDPFLRYVASLQTLFGRSGICLGTVTVHELPTWAVDRWSSVDVEDGTPCGDLSQLFTTSADENAVHVFLVDRLVATSLPGSTVVGIDGSIPGPSGFSGTIVSGAAVALGANLDTAAGCPVGFDPTGCDPDFLAYVTAHEAGHWLGLFHVTEAYGGLWDSLNDTATCDCPCLPTSGSRNACATGAPGGEVLPQHCNRSATCGGGDNLMFWLFQGGVSVGNTSPEQGRVMRLNPAVR